MQRVERIILVGVLVIICPVGGVARGQQSSGLDLAIAIQNRLVEAISKAEPSIVAIARVKKLRVGDEIAREERPDPFSRLPLIIPTPQPADPDFIPNEYATGVVVDPAGLILTAYHVLADESDYYITTRDRKVYRAWVKAADPRSDMAVLSIDAVNLHPITLGDASQLKKGQFVITLGNPHAIARDGQASASWGIVANLARKATLESGHAESTRKPTIHHFGTLIQTDAKLNLGTSGGALLNLDGQMVGLTTSMAAVAGYERAAGYAYPVDATFHRVLDTLKQGREVEYGFLGIRPTNLSLQETHRGLSGTRAVVMPGTPAERFGLRTGDIITTVNRVPIHDADGLVLEVGRLPVESKVRLGVIRNDRSSDIQVVLTKFPIQGKQIISSIRPNWRGLRVDYFSAVVDSDGRGLLGSIAFDDVVIVTDVAEGSLAWEAGLRPRDLISHVDRQSVGNPRAFESALANKTGAVRLRVREMDGESEQVRLIPPE